MSSRFAGEGEIIRRRSSLFVWAGLLYCTWWVMVLAHTPPWALFFVGLVVMSLVVFATRREVWVGLVEADERGLLFRGQLLVPRSRIETAYVLSEEPPIVSIASSRSWPIRVRLTDEADAQTLLKALGRGVEESKASFRVADPRAGALPFALGFFILVVPTHLLATDLPNSHFFFALSYGLWGLFGSVAGLLGTASLEVGRDGLLLRRRFGSRYIPYGSLDGAWGRETTLVIRPRDDKPLRLTVAQGSRADREQLCDAIVRRIDAAREAFAHSVPVEGAAALVAPGGRSATQWVRELRALVRARTYREAVMDADRLWRVVDDPSMGASTRAGAAMALAALDDDARSRLRLAADACADPKLRVALAHVADGAGETEVEAALASLLGAGRV